MIFYRGREILNQVTQQAILTLSWRPKSIEKFKNISMLVVKVFKFWCLTLIRCWIDMDISTASYSALKKHWKLVINIRFDSTDSIWNPRFLCSSARDVNNQILAHVLVCEKSAVLYVLLPMGLKQSDHCRRLWCFQFSIWLMCSFVEVHFAENPTWIRPVIPSNWRILRTIENKRNSFLFVAIPHNQCSRLLDGNTYTQNRKYFWPNDYRISKQFLYFKWKSLWRLSRYIMY